MSSSNSPCAACKIQRRKCTQECVFAPYFLPEKPEKFASVHKVFGAKNVAKLLSELNAAQREEAVHSLYFEAEHRLHDPVYGVVGPINDLQNRLRVLNDEIDKARKELSFYIGAQAFIPMVQSSSHPHLFPPQYGSFGSGQPIQQFLQPHMCQHFPLSQQHQLQFPINNHLQGGYAMLPSCGHGMGDCTQALTIREPRQQLPQEHQQHHIYDTQHIATAVAVRELQHQEEMIRSFDHHDLMRFPAAAFGDPSTSTSHGGFFNNVSDQRVSGGEEASATIPLGSFDAVYHMQPQLHQGQQDQTVTIDHMDAQLFLQPSVSHQDRISHRLTSESDKGKSVELPS